MHVAAELLSLRDTPHRRHDAVADDERADVLALALGDEFLDQHVLLLALQQLDDRLGRLDGFGQQHADALRSFDQLDDHRRAAHAFDGGQHVFLVAHERRARNADVVPAEDLQAAQLVARVGDAVGGVGAEHVHLLELPNDGGAVVGDRGADARQHRVVVAQEFLPVVEVRRTPLQIDGELQGVEHLDLVVSLQRGFLEPTGAVRLGSA